MKTVFVFFVIVAVALLCGGCPSTDFYFVQMADLHVIANPNSSRNNDTSAVIQGINEQLPDAKLVLVCGDVSDTPNARGDVNGNEIELVIAKGMLDDLIMPWYAVPGNHDVNTECKPRNLALWNDVIGPDRVITLHNGYAFIGVNSQLWMRWRSDSDDIDALEHMQWFESALHAAKTLRHKIIVFGHHPLFISEPEESLDNWNIPLEPRRYILDLLKEYSVVAYLSGHTHTLQVMTHDGTIHATATAVGGNPNRPVFLWHIKNGEAPDIQYASFR